MVCKNIDYKLKTIDNKLISIPEESFEEAGLILKHRKNKDIFKVQNVSMMVRDVLYNYVNDFLSDAVTEDLVTLNIAFNYAMFNGNNQQAKNIDEVLYEISCSHFRPYTRPEFIILSNVNI